MKQATFSSRYQSLKNEVIEFIKSHKENSTDECDIITVNDNGELIDVEMREYQDGEVTTYFDGEFFATFDLSDIDLSDLCDMADGLVNQ